MTRRLPSYPDTRLCAAFDKQSEANPGTHDELLADYAAEALTGGQADDTALEHVAREILRAVEDRRARQAIERAG